MAVGVNTSHPTVWAGVGRTRYMQEAGGGRRSRLEKGVPAAGQRGLEVGGLRSTHDASEPLTENDARCERDGDTAGLGQLSQGGRGVVRQ